MLYTCINACPSFPTQDCFDVKQKLVSQSNWKLYTIYKDQAIVLDEKLLFLFKDAMFLYLYYSNQINSNEITNCDVCIANYIHVISFIKILYQYSLFLYVGTNDSIVNQFPGKYKKDATSTQRLFFIANFQNILFHVLHMYKKRRDINRNEMYIITASKEFIEKIVHWTVIRFAIGTVGSLYVARTRGVQLAFHSFRIVKKLIYFLTIIVK